MDTTDTQNDSRWKRTMMIGSTVTVVLSMASAMYFSGWSMWHVIEDKFGLTGKPELIIPMFVLFDLAAISCALLAVYNRLSRRPLGIPYLMVWVFSAVSGLMSATDGKNLTSQAMRFAAPLVAATMLELLLSAKKHADAGTDGWITRALRPVKARLGLLDRVQSDDQAARAAAAGKLATRAYRMHQLKTGSRRRKFAERKFLRKLRAAIERHGIATDAEMITEVQASLATLFSAVDGTSPEAVRNMSPWSRPAAPEVPARVERKVPVPADALEVAPPAEPVTVPDVAAYGPGNGHVKQPRRSGDETRELYTRLTLERPGLKQKEAAELLGISERALRNALNATKEAV